MSKIIKYAEINISYITADLDIVTEYIKCLSSIWIARYLSQISIFLRVYWRFHHET